MADGLLSQPITARDAFGHGGLPMDLNPDDTPVGYDDAGMPVFRGRTGQVYHVSQQPTQPSSIWDMFTGPARAMSGKAVSLEDVWNAAGAAMTGSRGM